MLIDSNSLDAGSDLRARICVIGSGMGGATLAQRLANAKQDVLLIEAGNAQLSSNGSEPVLSEHSGRSFNMPLTRCIELGGTTNQWHGICAPLDEIDFQARPWISGSGWPITRNELKRYYLAAAQLFGVPEIGWFDSNVLNGDLKAQLAALQFDTRIMRPKVVATRAPPLRWKPALLRMAREGRLRCAINSTALELITRADGQAVEYLLVGTARGTLQVRADVFVVSCGGLESPRLLLNSRRVHPGGVGNDHDQVGRNLIDHPAGHFCKLGFKQATHAPLFAGMPVNEHAGAIAGLMLAPEHQATHRLPNNYVWIRPSVTAARMDDELMLSYLKVRSVRDLSFRQVVGILSHRDILYRVLVHRFGLRPKYRFGDLWFMTEQLPNLNSRVGLSTRLKDRHGYPVACVNWQLSDADLHGFFGYVRVLLERGLRSPQYALARRDEPELWSRTVASAAHHLGTARMADHPSRGVVDSQLKVFGTSNLFVCDASVFPTAGSVNPSLTIAALALRLADHLCRRW